jgi:soluble lytic murein transglycosylase
MQMIPPTAREIAEDLGIRGFEFPRDLEQPPLNVRMGSYYLAKVLRKYQGNVPLALASYNAGPGRMDRWLKFRPSLAGLAQSRSSSADDELWFDELPWSETCYYVKAILRNLLIYRALDQGRVEIGDAAWAAPRPEPRPGPRPTPSETARNSR